MEEETRLRDAVERLCLDIPDYGYRRVTAQLHWVKRLHSSLGYLPPVEFEEAFVADQARLTLTSKS